MTVVVDDEQQMDAGYMAIHESSASGGPGPVIGNSAYLPAGAHDQGLKVTVDRPLKDGETVWAMLHTENNGNQTYDGASIDLPTVSTKCGNSVAGNIATFPIKIKVAAAARGGNGGNGAAPAAPKTGSGVESGSSDTTLYAILAAIGAAIIAGSGGILAFRRRQG
jgi:hypothetical protein